MGQPLAAASAKSGRAAEAGPQQRLLMVAVGQVADGQGRRVEVAGRIRPWCSGAGQRGSRADQPVSRHRARMRSRNSR
jgi:hypothetical protein